MARRPTVSELVTRPAEEIKDALGGIYEHSPWVAEDFVAAQQKTKQPAASASSNIATVSQLAAALKATVDAASRERKLALLRAHPDLCEKVGKLERLTEESREEQGRSGLQSLTDAELEEFHLCNTRYRDANGFPFILAVRNATKHTVLAALRGRVRNPPELEFATALQQVHKIAWMRLLSKIDTSDAKGFLTCHVLDTANGCPGELGGLIYSILEQGACTHADCSFLCTHTQVSHHSTYMMSTKSNVHPQPVACASCCTAYLPPRRSRWD